jgi:hypothetical protein
MMDQPGQCLATKTSVHARCHLRDIFSAAAYRPVLTSKQGEPDNRQ